MADSPGTNLRDLGGTPAADGRVVRPRTLLRSEAPATLTAASVAQLADVPVRLVYDLRSVGEVEPLPPIWSAGSPEVVNVPLLGPVDPSGNDPFKDIVSDLSGDAGREYMRTFYAAIVRQLPGGGGLADFTRRVGGGDTPVMVHCMGGQDRTGVFVAVILLALGVPRERIVADYMVTLDHYTPERIHRWFVSLAGGVDIPREALAGFAVAPEYIEAPLDFIASEYGSVEAYFEAAGVTEAELSALRDALLD